MQTSVSISMWALTLIACGPPRVPTQSATTTVSATTPTAAPPAMTQPLANDAIQHILDGPDWLTHLGGDVVDEFCPDKLLDAKHQTTGLDIGVAASGDAEHLSDQYFYTNDMKPESFAKLYAYIETGAKLPDHSVIYRRFDRATQWVGYCVVDSLALRSSDFQQAKAKNDVRILPSTLTKLRALDPAMRTLILTIDGTFVEALPLQGLRTLKDPVLTVEP